MVGGEGEASGPLQRGKKGLNSPEAGRIQEEILVVRGLWSENGDGGLAIAQRKKGYGGMGAEGAESGEEKRKPQQKDGVCGREKNYNDQKLKATHRRDKREELLA